MWAANERRTRGVGRERESDRDEGWRMKEEKERQEVSEGWLSGGLITDDPLPQPAVLASATRGVSRAEVHPNASWSPPTHTQEDLQKRPKRSNGKEEASPASTHTHTLFFPLWRSFGGKGIS